MSAENTPSTTTPTTDTRELAAHFAATLGQLSSPASNTEEPAHQSKDYALLRDPVLHNERLDSIRQKKGYIIDMDGVIYHVSERWAKKKKKKVVSKKTLTYSLLSIRETTFCLVLRNSSTFCKQTTKSSSF
jgi:hypothetical protein